MQVVWIIKITEGLQYQVLQKNVFVFTDSSVAITLVKPTVFGSSNSNLH